MLGLVFALGGNALNPDGLSLTTNYFPRAPVTASVPAPEAAPEPGTPDEVAAPDADGDATNGTAPAPDTPPPAPEAHVVDPAVVARLEAKGLKVLPHHDVVATFEDPAYQVGLYVFVDARDDQAFGEGHIPGAIQYNHYKSDEYIGPVLEAAAPAARVVVYCIGGDCEDSEFAAVNLMLAGVDASKLFIYVGGIQQWKAADLPLETGP